MYFNFFIGYLAQKFATKQYIEFNICIQIKVARTACVAACQHINKKLLNIMLEDEVKQISLGALKQLDLDLIQCERTLS